MSDEGALVVGLDDYFATSRRCRCQASPEKKVVGRIPFGEGLYGGECPFISVGDEEDDGYIATFVGRADGTGTSGERELFPYSI